MVIYNFISTLFLLILTSYSYFLFNSHVIFVLLLLLTIISFVAHNFTHILRGTWYTITTFTNIFSLILLIYFGFNLPIKLKFNEKLVFQRKPEEKSNIIKLKDKLETFEEIFQEIDLKKLKESKIDSKDILPLLAKNQDPISNLFDFINSKKIVAYEDLDWATIQKLLQVKLYEIDYNLKDEEFDTARDQFELLLIALNNFSLNTFNKKGAIEFYGVLDTVYDFYIKNHKRLDLDNEVLIFSENILNRGISLQIDSLKIEVNRIKSELDGYTSLTTYVNNKNKTKVYKSINLIWPLFDRNKSKSAIEDYFLGILVLFNNNYFMAAQEINDYNFLKDKLYGLTNPYGNYLLPGFTEGLAEDYYIRERVLSKVEAVKGLLSGDIKTTTDRLSGDNYIVNEFRNKMEIRSKYEWNKKPAFSFTYYK